MEQREGFKCFQGDAYKCSGVLPQKVCAADREPVGEGIPSEAGGPGDDSDVAERKALSGIGGPRGRSGPRAGEMVPAQ